MILNIICSLKSKVSREYVNMSIDSFDPLIQKNYISDVKLIPYVAVETLRFRELYNYTNHLEFGQRNKKFEPTEISLQETHIDLWDSILDNPDKNWIGEHDAYLYPDMVDDAMRLLDHIHVVDPYYANIGLYTCFYYINNDAIKMFKELLVNKGFPINSGPYGLLERLFKTSMDRYVKDERGGYGNKEFNYVLPYANHKTLNFGMSPTDIHIPFNFPDRDAKNNPNKTPVTQIYSHRLSTTLHHRGHKKNYTRYHKVIP